MVCIFSAQIVGRNEVATRFLRRFDKKVSVAQVGTLPTQTVFFTRLRSTGNAPRRANTFNNIVIVYVFS